MRKIMQSTQPSTFGTGMTIPLMFIALVVLVGLGELIKEPLLLPPLAATAAYVFGAPGIPGTQPRSIIGGNMIAALSGFGLSYLLGNNAWVAIIAAASTALLMNKARLFHIPAVATAALVVVVHPPHRILFLGLLLLSSIILSVSGFMLSKVTKRIEYPLYW